MIESNANIKLDSYTNKYKRDSDGGISWLPLLNYTSRHETCLMWNQCKRLPIQDKGEHTSLYISIQCIFMSLDLRYTRIKWY